jgi:hypothetical protein
MRLWQTVAVLLSFLPIASAASVAVLDFDAYAVPHDDALFVAEQVRDTFLSEGWLDPMSATDIADATVRGHEDALRRARERVAAGRTRWSAGDAEAAAAAWQDAVALHFEARSDIARRTELADAAWSLAMALGTLGDTDGAAAALSTVAGMFPGYHESRAADRPLELVAQFREVEAVRLRAQPRKWAESALAGLEDTLGVDYVVTGSVRSDGRVVARIYDAGVLLGESSGMLAASPPALFDPAYMAIASELARAAGVLEAPPSVPSDDPEEVERAADDVPSRSAERAAEDAYVPERGTSGAGRTSDAPVRNAPARATADAGATRDARAEPRAGRTTVGGRSGVVAATEQERPVTERWWFWTLLFSATAGAGVAVVGWMYEPRPIVEEVPDAYTVTIVAPSE